MYVRTILARARSALGKRTKYESPGSPPNAAASSWPASGARCDCSGFVAWCLGWDRHLKNNDFYRKANNGWFETSAVFADGLARDGLFSKIGVPRPGALLVYPDYKDAAGSAIDGHIGIVTSISPGIAGAGGVTGVIHCSLGNWNAYGDAVRETPPTAWTRHGNYIAVWLDGLIDDEAFATPPFNPNLLATNAGGAGARQA